MALTEEERKALQKRYFPRVPWGDQGPVRRRYKVRNADGVPGSPTDALIALAKDAHFIAPDQHAVTGGPEEGLEAFRHKAEDPSIGMIFGDSIDAHWCDIAVEAPDPEGWHRLIVRSEEGENLIALAHEEGLLRFRRDQ